MSKELYRKCKTCKGMRIAFEYEPGPNATHSERCRTCDGWGFVPVEVQGDSAAVRIEMPGSHRVVTLSIGDYQLTYDHSAQQWVFVGQDGATEESSFEQDTDAAADAVLRLIAGGE